MVLGLKEINATGVIVPGGATQLTTEERVENYKEFASFLEVLIFKSQGSLPKHLLPPFLEGLQRLANEMLSDVRMVEIIQSCPPLMPLQHKAVFYRRVFNIHERIDLVVRHGLPGAGLVASGKTADVKNLQQQLLKSVPYTVGPDLWGDMALSNLEVFNIFMSISALKKNDAEGLTRMLRVMVSHPFGPKVVDLMQELQQVENDAKAGRRLNRRAKYLAVRACSSTLQTIPPACREVIRLADQTYPAYPIAVATGFWKSGAYGLLDMPGLMRPL
ncbi:uncharacterized protein LOC125515825 [Triticum urartu]|nr:uncharacterized protein LOC125515825 [Triticum urartu]XP_048537292.1 uncharacterized protein LOC125515825 [Triticum urartu]